MQYSQSLHGVKYFLSRLRKNSVTLTSGVYKDIAVNKTTLIHQKLILTLFSRHEAMQPNFFGCLTYFSIKTPLSCSVQKLHFNIDALLTAVGSSIRPFSLRKRNRRLLASSRGGGWAARLRSFSITI